MPPSGTMQVTTPKGRWLVPPDRAVWVPARLEHAIDVLADIEMRTLYFDLAWLKREARSDEPRRGIRGAGVAAAAPGDPRAVRRPQRPRSAPRCWCGWRCWNCTRPRIPRPSSRCRTSRAAGAPPTSCSATRPAAHEIETLAREVGTSARTLSRLFSSETQLSFKSWCQRARIAAAIEKLSTDANVSVKQLASDLGYASVPAFSHAFRQVTGKTPTEFAGKE